MTPTKSKLRDLTLEPQDVAEFFKPARLEIYESLQASGPASIAELAARLGRAPDSLYYHVRKLVELGVLARREGEQSGSGDPGRNGAVYESAARAVQMDLDSGSQASRQAWSRGAAAVLRLTARDFDTALEDEATRTTGARRNLMVQRKKVRLKDADLRRVNGLLDELFEILRTHAGSDEGQLFALTCAMAPLPESTR